MVLDTNSAREGIERVIGKAMGLSAEEAAWGIREVVNENMASAFRPPKGAATCRPRHWLLSVVPGRFMPTEWRANLASKSVPRAAGVFSALGFLVTPVSYEVSRTTVMRLSGATGEFGVLVS